jgi:CDGSH-type Zn-finger protein
VEKDPKRSLWAATIDVSTDGPYLVRGLAALRNSRGESLETQGTIALCRCGGSANKPFCDGTHKRIGFVGRSESDPSKRSTREYTGAEITIHDRRWICSHAAECVDGLPTVWRKGEKPWIVPDAGGVPQIVEVIRRCPSGALSYSMGGTEIQGPEASRPPTVTLARNGPYHVTGGPVLRDPSGIEPPVREHYVLCRCGQSKNKPFCDGQHAIVGFDDGGS